MTAQWLSLIATIWLQSISGTNSNFPAYSSELKRILSISQLQLNNLASASDAGKLLGWLSGIAAAHLPLRLVLLIGSLLGLISYGIQFLFLTNQAHSLSYYHVFTLNVIAGNSICWINTVCYIIAIRNFPFDRQVAVGLSTSYVGLSAKIYTAVVDVLFSSSEAERARAFLVLNAVLPLAVCVVAVPLVRVIDVEKSRGLERGFLGMCVITMATGLFAVITSLRFLSSRHGWMILVGMFVFMVLPILVPAAENVREGVQRKCLIRVHDDEGFTSFAQSKDDDELEEVRGSDIGAKLMLRSVEFWLYFCVYLFGATIGLVYLNNLGQIGESRGCSGTSCSLVSVSSAFGFFGRLLPSLLDYFYPRHLAICGSKRLVSGAAAMGIMMIPMCVAFLLLLNGQNISLYISTAIIGTCTGAITSISVSTTTQLFGTKNFGVNHNILVSNISIGSFLFGGLAAMLYKRRINVRGDTCVGQKCYQLTFIIWGSLCVVGTLLSFVLHARTKKMYSSVNRR
ncbi:hypothetical protein CASFOL_002878 [Castilleja foliolosa]|uniref:Nodulin-like domain-containing protein n=1 Tax=Castilleja foliolosa TaxID=1961234 RepID=A0ABD3EHH3_9LAMI